MNNSSIFYNNHKLAVFYREIVWKKLPHDRNDIVLLTIDDVLVVNLDAIYERTLGYRAIDQLVYLIHKHGKEKRFIFLSRDGANIALTGIQHLIEETVRIFKLDQSKCLLVCREPISINGVEVINWDSILYWCVSLHSFLHKIPIIFEPIEKKFAAWFHRGTFTRLHLIRHLHDNYYNDSYLAYQENFNKKMICDVKLFNFFDEELKWAKDHAPIVFDQLFPIQTYTLEQILTPDRKPYGKYFLDIVGETNILDTSWLTEKTIRNLYTGTPFIVMSGAGTLEKLKEYGFQTFSPFINEKYDLIENVYDRLEELKKEIDRIAKFSYDELLDLKKEMAPILQHNKERCLFLANEINT